MPFRHAFAQSFGLEVPIAAAVFGLVLLAMVIALAISRARRRQGKGSSQRAENNRLELSYAAVVAAAAAVLATGSLVINNHETADPPAAALTIRVTAYQWCWRFHYAGQPVTIKGDCVGGRRPTLVLPANREVRIVVTSSDVIHGFWLPYLRWKIYAYPGHDNSFTVRLTHTGRWIGRCSEFCGLYHDKMDYYLQVVSPARFDHWMHAHGGSATTVAPS